MRRVALLRAVNVGGNNKVPMKELAALYAGLGAVDVKTYIQSGNVVYDGPADLDARVESAIHERFGFVVPVAVRTAAELAAVLANNPFPEVAEGLHVGFLRDHPAKTALDPNRSPGDSFALVGRELYLHLRGGVAGTKLTTAWLDRQLGTVVTMRNWRTTLELARLASA